MNKRELQEKTDAVISETRAALQTVYDALNHGQQKKILKDPAVAALIERYGVEVTT
jgi:hypothetical protein